MRIRQFRRIRPGIELLLDPGQVPFGGRRLGDIQTRVAQAPNDVARQHEAILAEKAQKILAGVATQPRSTTDQQSLQSDLVRRRPSGKETPKTAMFGSE